MKIIQLIILIILPFWIISCSSREENQEIVVATAADNPPYEFIHDGRIIGLDIDIINAITEKLGKKIVIKNFDFNGLLAALASKNSDMIIAGLTVTEERKQHVSFSIPYIKTNVSVLYRLADQIKSIKDLENKVIGVQLGTTWEIISKNFAKQSNIKINSLSNNLMLVEELKTKAIDAVLLEELQAKQFIENNHELASFSLTELSSRLAIAMEKDSKLITQVNKAIRELEQEGIISKIREKWLRQ